MTKISKQLRLSNVRISGTPILCCLVDKPVSSSASERYSERGMHAKTDREKINDKPIILDSKLLNVVRLHKLKTRLCMLFSLTTKQ